MRPHMLQEKTTLLKVAIWAMLVPEDSFEQETPYHIVDWRSYKLPRVARSSLSAEAQAAGGASDTAEFISRFWSIIFDPKPSLRERLHEVSALKPTLITDAKALYDAWHKETATSASSSVDKRTYLEIKVAKQQVCELGGCLKWISSERQFADGLTKSSTRGLLADRVRRRKIKLAWDPHYTAAKKKSKQEREASRQEFADPKSRKKKKPTKNERTTNNLQLNHTDNLESVQEEPHEAELALLDSSPNEDFAARSGTTTLRSPMALLVFFTQLKAVTAEFFGDHAQMDDAGVCTLDDDPDAGGYFLWCLALFMLIAVLILCYLSYKLGRFLERKSQVRDLTVKLRVANARDQRRFDAALDEQNLRLDHRMAQLENDLVKAAETNFENKRHHNEMMEQWNIEQQEAETIDQAFQQCQGLLWRCYNELLYHFEEECPAEHGVLVAPFGHVWHTTSECQGLKQAHRVDRRPVCHHCEPLPRTPNVVNGPSRTTLAQDMGSWRQQWGYLSYEAWMTD